MLAKLTHLFYECPANRRFVKKTPISMLPLTSFSTFSMHLIKNPPRKSLSGWSKFLWAGFDCTCHYKDLNYCNESHIEFKTDQEFLMTLTFRLAGSSFKQTRRTVIEDISFAKICEKMLISRKFKIIIEKIVVINYIKHSIGDWRID